VFLGFGQTAGEEEHGPTEAEEESNRPLWLMMAPCLLLLAGALAGGHVTSGFLLQAAPSFMHPDQMPVVPPYPAELHPLGPWIAVAAAVALAAWDLGQRYVPPRLLGVVDAATRAFRPLDAVHSGVVGDYVAWMVLGLGIFAIVLLIG
jgi:multicomponent Na+:H+ antiporter subunit D